MGIKTLLDNQLTENCKPLFNCDDLILQITINKIVHYDREFLQPKPKMLSITRDIKWQV